MIDTNKMQLFGNGCMEILCVRGAMYKVSAKYRECGSIAAVAGHV